MKVNRPLLILKLLVSCMKSIVHQNTFCGIGRNILRVISMGETSEVYLKPVFRGLLFSLFPLLSWACLAEKVQRKLAKSLAFD